MIQIEKCDHDLEWLMVQKKSFTLFCFAKKKSFDISAQRSAKYNRSIERERVFLNHPSHDLEKKRTELLNFPPIFPQNKNNALFSSKSSCNRLQTSHTFVCEIFVSKLSN